MTPEIYPSDGWLKKFPMPDDFEGKRIPETLAMVDKCQAYVTATEVLQVVLGKHWTLPMEQQWWWQFTYLEHKNRGIEKSFTRQHPCVTGDMLVSTERGIMSIIKAENAKRCESGRIVKWIPRGRKPIFELSTRDGRIMRGTEDHRIHLYDGTWKEMGNLLPGDGVKLSAPIFAETPFVHEWNDAPMYKCERVIDEEMGRFLGYFMGDGSYISNSIEMSCDAKDEDTIADISYLIEKFTGKVASVRHIGGLTRVRSGYVYWMPFLRSIGALAGVIHQDGHKDGYRRKVNVPECIMLSSRPVVRQFLRALFECDAHANKKQPMVNLSSAHDDFLREVQHLLLGFNIRAKFMKQKKVAGATIQRGKRREYTSRELSIQSAWVNSFYEQIGFVSARKQQGGKRKTSGRYADASLIDEVLSVVDLHREEEVYDLSVELTHKFGANGIEVHNCDDFEALIGDNDKAIGDEAIENMTRTVTDECQIYMVAGEGIEKKDEPAPMLIRGEDALRLYSKWTTPKGESLDWGFIPVIGLTQQEEFDPMKKVLVFEEPRPGFDYGIGCDTGTGVELDRSTIIVTRKGEDDEPDVQVAEFADDTIGNTELYAWLAAVTALYSTYMREWPHPKLAIEMRRKYGDACLAGVLSPQPPSSAS